MPPALVDGAQQRRHLHRRPRGLAALVARAGPRAHLGLLVGERRQHAERDRHAGRQADFGDAARRGLGDVFEVHRVALDQAAEADDARRSGRSRRAAARRAAARRRPGTRTTRHVVVAARRPRSSASRAPASSPSVISGLKRDTTIANRQPAARWAPCHSSTSALRSAGRRAGQADGARAGDGWSRLSNIGARTNYTPRPAGARARERARRVGQPVGGRRRCGPARTTDATRRSRRRPRRSPRRRPRRAASAPAATPPASARADRDGQPHVAERVALLVGDLRRQRRVGLRRQRRR